MKKVKYVGSLPCDLPTLGLFVSPGDAIDVPDDFINSQFEDAPAKRTASVPDTQNAQAKEANA